MLNPRVEGRGDLLEFVVEFREYIISKVGKLRGVYGFICG